MLDSLKSFEEIKKRWLRSFASMPNWQWLQQSWRQIPWLCGTRRITWNLVSLTIPLSVCWSVWSVDEMYKAGSSTIDNLVNPETALSEEPNQAPFNTRFETPLGLFEWYEQPANRYRLERFGLAMDAGRSAVPPDLILKGQWVWRDGWLLLILTKASTGVHWTLKFS